MRYTIFKCRFFIMIFLSSISSVLVFGKTEHIEFARHDGSRIEGYISLPSDPNPFPLVLVLQGSESVSVIENHEKVAFQLVPSSLGVVTIEKRGIANQKVNEKEYNRYDAIENRVKDYVAVLEQLKSKSIPNWNGKLILFGGSEGGRIAPWVLNIHQENVIGVILLGCGGGLPFSEDMKQQLILQGKKAKQKGMTAREIEKKFIEMQNNPTADKIWCGKNYKWFASHLNYDSLPNMLKLSIPVYLIHGRNDEFITLESANLVKKAFDAAKKKNLTYVVYDDLGHHVNGKRQLYVDLIDWVQKLE